MKLTIYATILLLFSCNFKKESNTSTTTDTTKTITDTIFSETIPNDTFGKLFSNKRFKAVTVEKVGTDSFRIQGEGQIFEASFNWVLEDGHNELQKGFQMTDAGAPEWGKFEFIVHAPRQRINSTITLILFESSAMDGSRQHELPITLH